MMSSVLKMLFATVVGLALGLTLTAIAGENPWHVLQVILKSAFGSRYDFGMTLGQSLPVLFTGLAVYIGLKSGLFNVGAEGQLVMGAFTYALLGVLLQGFPSWLGMALCVMGGLLVSAAWAAIPALLLNKRGAHEVITGIMLNFIAAGLTGWWTMSAIRNPESQVAESANVDAAFRLENFSWFQDASINVSLLVGIGLVVLVSIWESNHISGFKLNVVGSSPMVAKHAGINSHQSKLGAFILSGAICSLVGFNEVLGNSGKFKLDFSPGYGFTGIAVALMARKNALGIIPAALLFGALQKGAGDLDFETEKITKEIAVLIQALVILCVASQRLSELDIVNRILSPFKRQKV